ELWVEHNVWGRFLSPHAADGAASLVCTATRAAADCPAEPAFVELSFERGVPIRINGVTMPLVELIASLGTIAGAHGIGRISGPAGTPTIVAEMPAAVVLAAAHRELRRRTLSSEVIEFSPLVADAYARLVTKGGWFTPMRRALDGFVDVAEESITGS